MNWLRSWMPLVALLPLCGTAAVELPPELRLLLERKAGFEMKQFPIGFWNYIELSTDPERIDEEQVKDWAEAGFTLPIGPETAWASEWNPEHLAIYRKILGWCDQYGMKMIVSDRRVKGSAEPDEAYKKAVKQAYADYQDCPAFFGFHIYDEPHAAVADAIAESVRIHREAAPDKHPFLNLVAAALGGNVAKHAPHVRDMVEKSTADLISFDVYTQTWPGRYGEHPYYGDIGFDQYFFNLLETREGANAAGAAFFVTPLSVGHFHFPEPTPVLLRWQFNTAVAAGASGVMWFYYYQRDIEHNSFGMPVNYRDEKTPTWHWLRDLHRTFHDRYGDLFNRLVSTRVTFQGIERTFGRGDKFTPNGIISGIQPFVYESSWADVNVLVGEFADADLNRYVMLVNLNRDRSVCLDLTFPGDDVTVTGFHPNGKQLAERGSRGENGFTTQTWLAPGQEFFVRVDSESARNTPIVSNNYCPTT